MRPARITSRDDSCVALASLHAHDLCRGRLGPSWSQRTSGIQIHHICAIVLVLEILLFDHLDLLVRIRLVGAVRINVVVHFLEVIGGRRLPLRDSSLAQVAAISTPVLSHPTGCAFRHKRRGTSQHIGRSRHLGLRSII